MSAALIDQIDPVFNDDAPPARLGVAAEKLRMASMVLSALAHHVDEQDDALNPHIERLECRAEELMRTARRLAQDMGMARLWGLDILFAPAASAAPARPDPANESIELEPLDLLTPLMSPEQPPRVVRPTTPPWTPQLVMPTPPLASAASASDESGY